MGQSMHRRFLSLEESEPQQSPSRRPKASSALATAAATLRRAALFRPIDLASPSTAASASAGAGSGGGGGGDGHTRSGTLRPVLVVAVERDNAVARLQAMIQGRGRFGGSSSSSSSSGMNRFGSSSGGGSKGADAFHFEDGAGTSRLGAVSAATVAGAARDLEFFFDELYGLHRFHSVDDYGDQMD